MAKLTNPTKVITGVCTFSYLNCWEPKAVEGGKPKFSVSLVIPKSDTKTVEKIRAAIHAAYEEGKTKLKGKLLICFPTSATTPLHPAAIISFR